MMRKPANVILWPLEGRREPIVATHPILTHLWRPARGVNILIVRISRSVAGYRMVSTMSGGVELPLRLSRLLSTDKLAPNLVQVLICLDQGAPLDILVALISLLLPISQVVDAVARTAHIPQRVRVRRNQAVRWVYKVERSFTILASDWFLISKGSGAQNVIRGVFWGGWRAQSVTRG